MLLTLKVLVDIRQHIRLRPAFSRLGITGQSTATCCEGSRSDAQTKSGPKL